MSLLESAILGVVQGLTEYLPISSTAHLRIVPALLGWPDPGAAYTAVIQLGTLLAVLLHYRRDLLAIGSGCILEARQGAWTTGSQLRLAAAIFAGTIPIGVCGLLFKDAIETTLRGLHVIAASLIGIALVLLYAERKSPHTRSASTLSFWEIQIIGMAQAVALIPGSSRSGTTLAAALLLGLKRDEAARFSFLLGIPAIAAAGLFELKHLVEAGITRDQTQTAALLVGIITATVSGWLAIEGLLRFLKSRSTMVFIVYRILLGTIILWLLGAGRLAS